MTPSHESESYGQRTIEPPPGSVDLLLIRHGQSQPYIDGVPFPLKDGHGDPALSELGQQQASLVADRLADTGIDVAYVTPLCRTSQTAAPLTERLGIVPVTEPDLREVHLGEWEAGQYRKMMAERDPLAMRVLAEERWDLIPGAEAGDAFAARVSAAITRIAAAHAGQRVAVFTHGGVIGEVLRLASKSRPFAFLGADNASISRLYLTPALWIVRSFNDAAHLEKLSQSPG